MNVLSKRTWEGVANMLRMSNIDVYYDNVRALDDVTLHVNDSPRA